MTDQHAEDVLCPSHPEVVIGKGSYDANGNYSANLVMCGKCWPIGRGSVPTEHSDGSGDPMASAPQGGA